MFCRNCGKNLAGSPDICPGCGAKPLSGTKFCNVCGATTTALTEICKKCGTRLVKAPAEYISSKSRLITTLLALFLGMFGAHRFYIGKIGTGLAMLILTILGVATIWHCLLGLVFLIPVGVWTLIDFITAVSGNEEDREGKPIKDW
jgi:TM2 domain-containing membrane protein YozV/RNA polymerase subunit RPABC4/transcription elongation factor Spt4